MTVVSFSPTFLADVERAVWAREGQAIKGGAEVRFICPAHPDKNPSARYHLESKVYRCDACGAGAGVLDLAEKLGIDGPRSSSAALPRLDASRSVAEYDYTDLDGTLLFQAVRYEPKRFSQRAPDGKLGWTYRLDGIKRVLYNLPNVAVAIETGLPVVGAEGEKDADNLTALGLCGTTSPMGAGKFRPEYADSLRGAEVWWFIDRDDAGRRHGHDVAGKCAGIVSSFKILEPPAPHKDVSDWIAAGATREDIERLATATTLYMAPVPEVRRGLSISASEFVTMNIPPARWVVESIWPEQAIGFIAGPPKAYKSFLALDLAFAVANGGNFLGRYAADPAGRGVMYVQMESSKPAFRDRVQSVASRFGGTAPGLRLITNEPVLLEDPSWVERIEAELETHRPALLILDPLASLTRGDENSSQEMGALIRLFRAWRDRFACAICVVHHTGKGGEKNGSKRSGEKMRGSSAFHGALEAALHVDRVDDDTPRINVRLECKESEPPHPFVCEFRPEGSELVIVGDMLAVTDSGIRETLIGMGEATVKEMCAALGDGARIGFVRDRLNSMAGVRVRPGTGTSNKAAIYFYDAS